MDVLRAFFQFGKGANSRARGFVEGVVHFQQQRMVALDNQRVVRLKAMQVVHARSSSLCSKCVVRGGIQEYTRNGCGGKEPHGSWHEAPPPTPPPPGRAALNEAALRRRSRGERALVKLGTLCRRS